MSETVRGWTTDVGVADNPFGLSESDFSYCLVEIVTNLLVVQALGGIADQEIWVLIIRRQQRVAEQEIFRQMICHGHRDGNQPILSELCLPDIDCSLVSPEVLHF